MENHFMKIVIIYGQNHKGSTYHISRMLAEKLDGEIKEFFLPKDFDQFCVGCGNCFTKGEVMCPHFEQLQPITTAIDESDVIILASPVYVFHVTGAMKSLLDHYGYRWMVHRPNERMFSKQAVCISTASGSGMKSANKDMADSTFFWGCAKTYKLGIAVWETDWKRVSEKIKAKAEHQTTSLSNMIKRNYKKIKPKIKSKIFFYIMRRVHKKGWNEIDQKYWFEKGWLGKIRPWK